MQDPFFCDHCDRFVTTVTDAPVPVPLTAHRVGVLPRSERRVCVPACRRRDSASETKSQGYHFGRLFGWGATVAFRLLGSGDAPGA